MALLRLGVSLFLREPCLKSSPVRNVSGNCEFPTSCSAARSSAPAAARPLPERRPSAPPTAAFAEETNRGLAPLPPDSAYPKVEFDNYSGLRRDRQALVRRDAAPHRGVLILVLGILSLVVCGFLGPVAWIMGNNDLAEIRAGRMDREGEGMTQAGRICGMIASILLIFVCVLYGGIFAIALVGGLG